MIVSLAVSPGYPDSVSGLGDGEIFDGHQAPA
jgi:hypothetical protein